MAYTDLSIDFRERENQRKRQIEIEICKQFFSIWMLIYDDFRCVPDYGLRGKRKKF